MRHDEYEYLTRWKHAQPPATMSVDDIGRQDRTLVYGYDLDRTTVHVYKSGGELHALRYDSHGVIVGYVHGTTVDLEVLKPTKRAYPERTDYEFAAAMARVDSPLTFTTFDHSRAAAGDGRIFHAKVASTGAGIGDTAHECPDQTN